MIYALIMEETLVDSIKYLEAQIEELASIEEPGELRAADEGRAILEAQAAEVLFELVNKASKMEVLV